MRTLALYLTFLVLAPAVIGVARAAQATPLSTPEKGVTKGSAVKSAKKPATPKKDEYSTHDVTVIVDQGKSLDTKADATESKENIAIDRKLAFLTTLLVIAGFLTCGVIGWQSWETRRAAEAASNSVRLQEVALRQWVNIDNLEVRILGNHFSPTMGEVNLGISFKIVNPTRMPLTLDWVIVRIDDERKPTRHRHLLPPDDFYPIDRSIELRGEQFKAYAIYKLVLAVVVTIGYTDAFERTRKQAFGCLCRCGPPATCMTTPYQGDLPDDDIT